MKMKLTEQQKAANKAARSVRDKAYKARYKQLRDAIDKIETDAEVMRAFQAYQYVSALFDSAIENRDIQEQALRCQIAQLQVQIDALRQEPALQSLRENRSATEKSWRQAKESARKSVESSFPDMDGGARYYVTAWKPPAHVLRAMEEARKSVVGESEKEQ